MKRDDSHQINNPDADNKWNRMSTKYAATLCPLSKKSMSHRVVWQRISYDKGWHGGNQAKAVHRDATHDEHFAVAKCPFCNEYDSLDHIFRYCQHSDLPELRTAVFHELSEAITAIRGDKRCTQLNYDLAVSMRDMASTPLPLPTLSLGLHDGWQLWCGMWTHAHRQDLASRLMIHLPLSDQAKISLRRTGKQIGTILARGAWALWKRRCQLASKQQGKFERKLHTDDCVLRFDKHKADKDKRHPNPAQRMTAHFLKVVPLQPISQYHVRRIRSSSKRSSAGLRNKVFQDNEDSTDSEDHPVSRRLKPKPKGHTRWTRHTIILSDTEEGPTGPLQRRSNTRSRNIPLASNAPVYRNSPPRVFPPSQPVNIAPVYSQLLTTPASGSLVRGRITS